MKKQGIIIVFILIASYFLTTESFALWKQDAEVKFTLNISQPQEEGFGCGNYSTIQEGIDMLKDIKYNYIYNKMDQFESELAARVIELNNLPFGGITLAELQEECNNYRNVDITGFGTIINKYGDCINKLADFYRNSTQEEKNQVPDFWDQHNTLWDLHTQLWDKRQGLYDAVNAVWQAGEAKIDYNHGGKKQNN
ncbi:MAG: hypothetical protein RO469_11245 [Thermincola sp.]|jgi:hypothetical protein|nr:hypothetical protein [Thermincola sp.]MDT3701577.1 hypothetical protein [Thermincola sp.]